MYYISRTFSVISILGLFVVYLIGLIVPDLMEVDAAQYASISMEMAKSGNYLKVYHLSGNYLDKPPLLFWLGALFIKIFGVNHFAYRLPTFLFTILGVYATYSLGKRLYNKNTGILSGFILASSQIYVLHNHDVRTDTLLTNFVIIAIWQGISYLETNRIHNFIWAFVAVGFAMLAKGPIGAVVPVMAIGTHLLYKRDWSNIFNWRWILGGVIVLIVLSPMLWGLYEQFDLDPFAIVNNKQGVSGIRFFFWEQSFGRITGENVWKDDSSYFFFTHNYLWEFLPWSLIGIAALWTKLQKLVKDKFQYNDANEMYTLGGFILPFIALSTSHYKLPHYIMVIMPMAAIFTGAYMDKIIKSDDAKERTIFSGIQFGFSLLIGFLSLFILYFIFPANHAFWWLIPLLLFLLVVILFTRDDRVTKLIGPSMVAVILTNILLSGYFYPQLNKYQVGKLTADWVNEKHILPNELFTFQAHFHDMNFYSNEIDYEWVSLDRLKKESETREIYVFTNQKGLKELKDNYVTYKIEKQLYNFPNAELTTQFLNPKTRKKALERFYILEIEKNSGN